ncbi:hypothetical protein CR513_40308, partial [Mucuna pruriens]
QIKQGNEQQSAEQKKVTKAPNQYPSLKFKRTEIERQIGAIRAVRDVDIEHLLTELRLLRWCFSVEELQKPLLQVFEETLGNLSVISDEVKWREKESCNYTYFIYPCSRMLITCISRTFFVTSQRLSVGCHPKHLAAQTWRDASLRP